MLVAISAATAAPAAMVTNTDKGSVVVVIVANGKRAEVTIDAGTTEYICPSGCFITFPNGDRIGLEGSEVIRIVNGAGEID